MGKLVVLKLDGTLCEGFKVILELGEDGLRPDVELVGSLPANADLAETLECHWQKKYRDAGAPYRRTSYRIRPGEIYYNVREAKIKECEKSAFEVGERFKKWLKSEGFQPLDRGLCQKLSENDDIRFLIRTNDSRVKKLPWHLWDFGRDYQKSEFALGSLSSIVTKPVNHLLQDTVKILAILGHQEGIDVDRDREFLESLPRCEVTFLVEPTRKQVNDALWKKWEIIFFAGHSETEGENGKIYINPEESLEIKDLWYALRKAVDRGLKLAIFNSCDGLGLVEGLDDYQIPVAIVMRELVPDEVAQEFLKNFLDRFVNGMPFHLAVREAREQLQGLENKYPCATWLPVICQSPTASYPSWGDLESVGTPRPILKKWQAIALTSILTTSLVMGVRSLGLLEFFELKAYDAFMQMRPAEPPDDRILIIGITEEDLQNQPDRGNASISDRNLELLLEKLDALGARTIGLTLLRSFSVDSQHPELIDRLENSSNLIATCFSSIDAPDSETVIPPPEIQNIERVGFNNIFRDNGIDGVLRRQKLRMAPGHAPCHTSLSFSLQAAKHYLQQVGIETRETSDAYLHLGKTVFQTLEKDSGSYHNLDSRGGQIMLNYRAGDKVFPQVPLSAILSGGVNPDLVKDRLVLIGTTGTSMAKSFPTPITYNGSSARDGEMPTLIIEAHQVSQILSAVLDDRPLIRSWTNSTEFLWIFSWSVVGSLITILAFDLKKSVWIFLTGVGCIIITGSCWILFAYGWWVPWLPAILCFSGSTAAISRLTLENWISKQ